MEARLVDELPHAGPGW